MKIRSIFSTLSAVVVVAQVTAIPVLSQEAATGIPGLSLPIRPGSSIDKFPISRRDIPTPTDCDYLFASLFLKNKLVDSRNGANTMSAELRHDVLEFLRTTLEHLLRQEVENPALEDRFHRLVLELLRIVNCVDYHSNLLPDIDLADVVRGAWKKLINPSGIIPRTTRERILQLAKDFASTIENPNLKETVEGILNM